MESATVPRSKISPRSILVTIIVILLAALVVLLYLYLRLVQPPVQVNKPNIPGITHIFSIYGDGGDKLNKPSGTAVDSNGNIYIADTANGRVMVFDSSGQRLIRKVVIGAEEKARAERILTKMKQDKMAKLKKNNKNIKEKDVLSHDAVSFYPYSVALDKNNNIYVTCNVANKIFVYNSNWRKIRELKAWQPLNAVVNGDRVYVLGRKTIYIYSTGGTLLSKWCHFGKKAGEIDGPLALDVDQKGNIYISDTLNCRIQAFKQNGEVLWMMGRPTKSMDESNRVFGLPAGLAIGADGNLYVIDAFHGTIFVINDKGKKLAELGQMGSDDGQLEMPQLITHVRDNTFLVADKYNNRVQELAITPPSK